MKTTLKNIWMNCLLIGISFMFIISCTTSDYAVYGDFLLINKTKNQLELDFYDLGNIVRTDHINISDTLKLTISTDGPKKAYPNDIPFPVTCDSVYVKIDQKVWKIYRKDDTPDENNFLFTNNYKVERIDATAFIYTYTFDTN